MSFEKRNKTDNTLGSLVQAHLIKNKVETPLNAEHRDPNIARGYLEKGIFNFMHFMGLDMTDDSLVGTPSRVADMFVDELFVGLNYNNFPKCTAVENKAQYDELVIVGPIQTYSVCEHHLVTIDGKTIVGYIPNTKVLGLSKIARIVEFFARRPQIQERMTLQIWHALQYILETDDIIVIQKATHYCMKSRGVQNHSSETTTSKLGGKYLDNTTLRAEFLALLNLQS